MTTFLQAYADKIDNSKLRITLKLVKDLNSVTEKRFLLPDRKSDFINLTEDLYNSTNRPSYITKEDFQNDFISWTLSLDTETADAITITNHYNEIFKLTQEQASDFLGAQQASLNISINDYNNTINEQILNYEASKTTLDVSPSLPATLGILNEEGEEIGTTIRPLDNVKPSTGTSRPVVQLNNISVSNANTLSNLPVSISNNLRGIGGDRLIEPVPEPLLFPGDKNIAGENNAGITFGRDEIFRFRGHTKSGACYLYAGRSPNDVKTEIQNGTDGPGTNTALRKANDLVRDAAYLYLSQKSDPDALLKVAGGTYTKITGDSQSRVGKSLAALKADDVVIMSRETGIRLITGTDRTNSRGGQQISKFGIDLIAGNDDSDLQPLIKGDNLVKYLQGLSKSVDELRAVVYSFITSQIDMNSVLMNHQHPDPFSIFLGVMGNGNPLSLNGGKNYISKEVMDAGAKAILEGAQQQQNAITQMRNRINNDSNAFDDLGTYKIKSEKNRTN